MTLNPEVKQALMADIVRLYRTDMSCAKIGVELGMSSQSVYYLLCESGEPRRQQSAAQRAAVRPATYQTKRAHAGRAEANGDAWEKAARRSTQALFAKIRRHHPERCPS